MSGMLRKLFQDAPAALPEYSADRIEAALAECIARALKIQPAEVDAREPFENLGLDSRTAVSIAGQLEESLGREVPPTLLWDHPTIEEAAAFLARVEPQAVQ